MRKNIFIILILLSVLFLVFVVNNFSYAQDKPYPTIVKDYPTLKACQGQGGYAPCKPGDKGFGVPQFIRYIFIFALGSVGIVGLMAIIMAAFDYVMAIGNPQKASTAKDKLLSAFLGILLLLGSYVALNMINPDLLKLKLDVLPANINVESEDGNAPDHCHITNAAWSNTRVNEGLSSNFIFSYNEACSGQEINIEVNANSAGGLAGLHLVELGLASVRDDWCTGGPVINKTARTITLTFLFKKGGIYNYRKNQPELFFMDGHIKLNGVKQKLSNKVYITVNDLKTDGSCCK